MNIERRQKYSSKKSKEKEKFIVPFDLMSLNLFCSYILSENRNIRKSHLINIRNLFSVIHEDSFKKDEEKLKRVEFIKRGLDARITRNFNDPYLIVKYINGGLIEQDMLDPKGFIEVSNEELTWVNETVSSCIKNSYMNVHVEDMIELCTKYRVADYRTRGPLVAQFEKMIAELQSKFRKAKSQDSSEAMFSLKTGVFEESIRDIHEQLSNPANKLVCGMQGMNEMLSGGFESGRTYILFGLPGEGKSMTLLNLAYQLKKYNKNYKTKDPTKTPCIIFLTMENTVRESVQRLFNMSSTKEHITNFSVEEVIRRLKEDGELYLSDESPIDIIIKFVPNGSVDTSYMYTLTEDLEDEGYECICMIQDYIKRIKPADGSTGDIRIDLGNVVNDFKNYSAVKDVPTITASQLNRSATKHIDEGRKANKADLVRMLGRDNIGESMLILENIDGAWMLAPEYDAEGNKYMGIQRIKARYETTKRSHIYQPFDKDSEIKLVEDEGLIAPLFKDTLRVNGKEESSAKFNNSANASTYHINNIKNIDGDIKLLHSDDTNVYMNATSRFKQNPPIVINYNIPKLISPMYRPGMNPDTGLIKPLYKRSF